MPSQVFQPTPAVDLVTSPALAAVHLERVGPWGIAQGYWNDQAQHIEAALNAETPSGRPSGYAVLFGRMPAGVARPEWCVESVSYQWARDPKEGWSPVFTPTGLAQDALNASPDDVVPVMEWLLEQPDEARWVRLGTQHALNTRQPNPDPSTWRWLDMTSDEWLLLRNTPYQLYALQDALNGGVANAVIDDETKLHAGAVPKEAWSSYKGMRELVQQAGLTSAQRADLEAGRYSTGAYRSDLGQQKLTDMAHRTVARMLTDLLDAHNDQRYAICASNHGAFLPCVLPSGNGSTYTQSPWGYGAPLETRNALASVKLYGGGWGKPGVWNPLTRTHTILSGAAVTPGTKEYAEGLVGLARMRAYSALLANRQRLAVWLQVNPISDWQLATGDTLRLAWLLTAAGGTLFLTMDGDCPADYGQRFFAALDQARDEVLGELPAGELQLRCNLRAFASDANAIYAAKVGA